MDISSTANIKHPLQQPMLVIGGLAFGIISGLVLSLPMAPSASTPIKYSLPANINTAEQRDTQQEKANPVFATSYSELYAKAITTRPVLNKIDLPLARSAVNKIDPASAYLVASKSLTHDSKTVLASINNTSLKRPSWSWSREELSVTHASTDSVFGAPNRALDTTKIAAEKPQPEKTTPKQVANVSGTLDKDRLVVVLDPGHGGIDPGSEAPNGLVEKVLTLDMAKRVELFLSEIENVDVVMTRTKDVGMSRQNRVNKIKAVNADVVVSLHFNHLPQTDINLVETFYADRHNIIESLTKQKKSPGSVNLDYTNASRTLAHIMHNKVFNEVANANAPGAVIDAGVKRETLFVLTRSSTPGVLLELTCISNPAEADRLATPEYRDQLAASIADGLRDYLMDIHSEKFDDLLVKLDL